MEPKKAAKDWKNKGHTFSTLNQVFDIESMESIKSGLPILLISISIVCFSVALLFKKDFRADDGDNTFRPARQMAGLFNFKVVILRLNW